jgi:hypothetical protein
LTSVFLWAAALRKVPPLSEWITIIHSGLGSILVISTRALFLFWIVVWKLNWVTCMLYHGEENWKTCNFLYPPIRFMTQTVSHV